MDFISGDSVPGDDDLTDDSDSDIVLIHWKISALRPNQPLVIPPSATEGAPVDAPCSTEGAVKVSFPYMGPCTPCSSQPLSGRLKHSRKRIRRKDVDTRKCDANNYRLNTYILWISSRQ